LNFFFGSAMMSARREKEQTMPKTPSVSVIIPTYNRYPLLCEAIDSVLAQTDQDFELIVVDDGSTDDTPAVRSTYGDRLHYVYQDRKGVSTARNRGVDLAKGEWICFLDSDDLWRPQKLKIQKEEMKRDSQLQISYTEEIWYRRGVRVNPAKKHAKYSGWIFERCLPLCLISPSSVMVRRSLFQATGAFNEGFPVCEDYDLWLRISKDFPVHLVREPLIIKRNGHPGQLSADGWGFDRYRVESIAGVIRSGTLTDRQFQAACNVLRQKCSILSSGFSKRGKEEQAKYFAGMSNDLGCA
jgi:GT2 family glycosyltransferase